MRAMLLALFALIGPPAAVLNFTMNSLDGKPVKLETYEGNVVLMVNVASQCGYTYQYEGLQKLHDMYSARGLRILGFPSNDFGEQEPGTNTEIADFCKKNFGVKFDMFSKIVVLGPNKAPLYKYLTEGVPGFSGPIGWNFEKFLIGRDGKVIGRFKSPVEPLSKELTSAIEAALAK